MTRQHMGVDLINRDVLRLACGWEQRFAHSAQRAEARTAHFRPALPPVIKPPVVVMRNHRDLALFAGVDEFPGKDQVSPHARIVSPNETWLRNFPFEKPP